MRFSVKVGTLRDAVGLARHATPASPSMIAFGGVLINVNIEDNCVNVTGCDGDTTITAKFEANNLEKGQVLLPPRPLASYLSTLETSLIVMFEISSEGDVLIGTVGQPYSFRPLAATFPTPGLSTKDLTPANFTQLPAALGAVRHATSKDSAAIQLVSGEHGLTLNATDNYRLANSTIAEAGFGEFVGLIPLHVLERVSKSSPTGVSWDSRARTVIFYCQMATISTRLLATTFPTVDTVLSTVPDINVIVPTSEVLSALNRLAAVADQSAVSIRLIDKIMELRVMNADLGSGFEQIELNNNVDNEVELHVRLTYLAEALNACGSGDVTFAYTGALQPLFLLSHTAIRTVQVIMPIRL
jgi:DNA polymerase III sliding clamp (beta) subunit (PCNA family)